MAEAMTGPPTSLPSARSPRWWLTPSPERNPSWWTIACIAMFLAGIYCTALIGLWPGILGSDSIAILNEVTQPGRLHSGKTPIWYYIVSAFYLINDRVENVSLFMIAVATLVFTRILSWLWANQSKWIFAFCLIAIAVNPQMVRYIISLYPDGLFAVTMAGVLFECYLVIRRQRVTVFSWLLLALLLPMALDLRTNGRLLAVLPLLFIPLLGTGRQRWMFGTACLVGLALCVSANLGHRSMAQKAMQPLVLWETVNFLQPRPHERWRDKPRVSPLTIRTLEKYESIERLVNYYDPYYWDSLIFHEGGPRMAGMSKEDQKILRKEFWRYNLWQNLPDFFASRVNVFLAAALADGLHVANGYRSHVLPLFDTRSRADKFSSLGLTKHIDAIHGWSEAQRAWLWSPLPGVALVLWLLYRSLHHRNPLMLAITGIMLVEMGGIFIISIAAEHRYLLPLFTFPLVALPLLMDDRRHVKTTP